ncbi:MAG TPA: proton-conducting transporter membrane subunit [Candidatus Binataceae bacterium]|nr:proton-conducting transporter membrane subunit [Candidatus Binataceae bacterium]
MLSLLFFAAGAAGSLAFANRGRYPAFLGAGGIILGSLCGIVPAIRVALGAPPQALQIAWDVPYGSFYLQLDALSAFFLVPIFLVCAVAALYGIEYLEAFRGKRALAPAWFFLNLLTASMVVVVLAHNAVLFLVSWETMALSSFFLVTFEDEKESTRQAGWIYLVASHIGTAFLLVLFVLLSKSNGSLDFDRFSASVGPGLLFVLALIGFGTKAGFVPLHVWLPEAHPAAPSHVSAVMSAVMIKTGIYGLLRILTFLGPMQAWWGWTLCVVGLTSGIMGVLLALAQQDLKRLLAYSSVENIGIIALGLGSGVVGLSVGATSIAVLGFAGALLHVLNHALFKCLLFLDTGNVAHATHTREIDRLGGLLRHMPGTGVTFLIGAAAISGLPPLNGFISEYLTYLASFKGVISLDVSGSAPMLATIAGLALIGGLSAALFTKAFGIVFLGHPRSEAAEDAHEAGLAMLVPGFLLAAGCVLIGLLGSGVVRSMGPLISIVTGLPSIQVGRNLADAADSIASVVYFGTAVVGVAALLSLGRTLALARRQVAIAPTWDCGYSRPSPRMQYTGSSFTQPLTDAFAILLQKHQVFSRLTVLFPKRAEFHTHTDDPYQAYIFRPVLRSISGGMAYFRPLQQGKVQVYVLYIGVTLLILLLWQIA